MERMKSIGTEIRWGIIFVVMTLLWMVMEKLGGFYSALIQYHPIVTNFIAIPAILVFVLALRDKKIKDYNGQMTYKQGFICGAIITAIVTVISPLTQLIVSSVIAPEYFPNIIAYSVQTGKMTLQEANDYFNLTNYIVQGLFGAPVMGIITTAIVAIFIRTKTPPLENE